MNLGVEGSFKLRSVSRKSIDHFKSALSFQKWTQQMRDMLEARKHGDLAFRDKDFETAIDCDSQVKSTDAGRKSCSTGQLLENHEKLKNKVAAPKSDPSSAPPHITY